MTDAPAFNEGKIYGDDVLAEYVNEFKECPIDVEVTELPNATAAAMLGATIETPSKIYSSPEATMRLMAALAFTFAK